MTGVLDGLTSDEYCIPPSHGRMLCEERGKSHRTIWGRHYDFRGMTLETAERLPRQLRQLDATSQAVVIRALVGCDMEMLS